MPAWVGRFLYKHSCKDHNSKLDTFAGFALLILALGLGLAGCQGRQANPVSMVRANDDQLNCGELNTEVSANNSQIRQLSGQDEDVETGNVVAAIVFPFAIDLSSKEQIEMRALIDRNRHLTRLRKARDCAE